ncbi:MAG: response regulator transcription factor [Clostridia bacterium]|nr:response regulator transcription factor [Clostridia bacterium]
MNLIYCVEDDAGIRELISYALTSVGFSVEVFGEAESFFSAVSEKKPDLALLDIMLPGTDGMEILKEIRKSGNAMPIIMLTAKSDRMDKVKGLDAGADDYITKPFDVLELVSRIRAVLRRTPFNCKTEEYKELSLNYDERTVTVSGEAVVLTYKEFEMLYCLMTHKGTVVGREKILDKVWGTDFEGESRTLDVHVRTLRKKLGIAGEYIETIRNVGYKLG